MSTVSRQTVTHVAPLAVYAPTAISARVVLALVYIIIAERTFPTDRTSTGKRGVIWSWMAHTSPFTWMRGTGNLFHLTVFTCERQATLTGVAVDLIYTNALVQTRARCTFINVLLTIHTSKAKFALTGVAVVSIHTGATILTWV